MTTKSTRRNFFQKMGMVGLGISAAPLINSVSAASPSAKKKKIGYELGVASYGLRGLSFEDMVEAMKVLRIKNLSLKSVHLPFDLSDSELKARMKIMRDAGLNPYAPGVVYMKSEKAVHDSFAYTKATGMKMIVGVPNYDLLPLVEKKVKETDISVAIHNHGPDNPLYPSPEDAYNNIKDLDPRIGLCADLGHVYRGGLDPVKQLKLVKDRLLDIHIKDVSAASKAGHVCRPGEGVFDFKAVLKALVDIDYQGFVSMEYEAEKNNPIPGHAEMKGYMDGVLSTF